MDQLRDLFDQLGLVHLVGNFRDDEPFSLGTFVGLDHDLCAQLQEPTPRLVGFLDPAHAIDEAGRGKVRSGNFLHELGDRDLGVLQQQE